MRIFEKYKLLLFLVVTCILNSIMSFLIEPANGSSDTMWREYYQEEEIDMIFIGSSLCSATFDPQIFDERLGVKSFNLGTPMQALEQNRTALETALKDHEIKTVVIGMGFFVFQEDSFDEAEVTFEKELARNKGGIDGVVKSLEYIFSEDVRGTEKSLNYWFPWIYNKEGYSFELMTKNVHSKMELLKSGEQIENSQKGYRPYTGNVDTDKAAEENSFLTYSQTLQEDLLDKFESILELCKEEEVDVLVINTPHPDFDILSYGSELYEEHTSLIKTICEKNAVDYYDFSLAKEKIFDDDDTYYYDYEHLNYEGSQIFCHQLCDFMIRRQNGEEVEKDFYSVEEYFKKQK